MTTARRGHAVAASSLWQQPYAQAIAYAPGVAQLWIRQAAQAPTREERERLVRRVAHSSIGYGAHVAWGAIRHVPDCKIRCEMFDIIATTPQIKSSLNVEEAIRTECRQRWLSQENQRASLSTGPF